MAIFVGKNRTIYHFKAKLAYTFSQREEKLNESAELPPPKKKRKKKKKGKEG